MKKVRTLIRFFTSIVISAGALQPGPAGASNAAAGYISGLYAMSNGAVLFNTSGARSAVPSCQSSTFPNRFALDGSTVAGQAQVALLLNAYNLHKRITIFGQNACSIWGDTETVAYFLMED